MKIKVRYQVTEWKEEEREVPDDFNPLYLNGWQGGTDAAHFFALEEELKERVENYVDESIAIIYPDGSCEEY